MSPKMELATDTVLLFQLNRQRGGSLDIYTTSNVGHVSNRIAEFSASGVAAEDYDDTANITYDNMYYEEESSSSSSVTYDPQYVCVPRASKNVAFVASAKYTSSLQPDVIVKEVVLTDTPCTAETSPGNASTVILELQTGV